ncbi:hypothetical protein L5B71_08555 [Avibacterium sp. 21-586]|uniref:hypothetical protein n=1 Tax=Avibacterium sp. 21-586 TaxID=2911534 RepID=UPI0022451CDD|nr:hypothetical protein [Avibacterium sp. 21-586]MCW9710885.1 hypothetical protein [Avibacterium sp. 21-586]
MTMNYYAEIDAHLSLDMEAETKDDAICYIQELLNEISDWSGIDIKYRINFVNEECDDEE